MSHDDGNERLVNALRQSVLEVERLRRENERMVAARSEPLAIVGIGCRYPGGVRTPEDLFRLALLGRTR